MSRPTPPPQSKDPGVRISESSSLPPQKKDFGTRGPSPLTVAVHFIDWLAYNSPPRWVAIVVWLLFALALIVPAALLMIAP